MNVAVNSKEWESKGFRQEFSQATKFLIILSFITIGIQLMYDQAFNWSNIKRWLFSNAYFGYAFYFANAYLNDGLNKIYPWEKNPKARALIGIPTFLIMNLALLAFLIYFFQLYFLNIEDPQIFGRDHLGTYLISLTICLIATLFFHAVGFYNGMMRQVRLNEKLVEEKVSAELNALKSQVNPHFLFNSFNVLSGLIEENPKQANKFLDGLSKIYRYILEHREQDLTTLRKELAFAQKYMDLQKMRFEDSVTMDIRVAEVDLDAKLPSLSLQLLLENAIKHNGFDASEPLAIVIEKEGDMLKVENNMKRRLHLQGNNGIGLNNIAKRYALHNVEGFEYREQNEKFTVTLPLI